MLFTFVQNLIMEDYQQIIDKILAVSWDIGPKILMATASLFIGFYLIKKLKKLLKYPLEKARLGDGVTNFISSILDVVLKIAVILFAASFLGFQTSSLVAVIAAASFAVGLALQGSLSNFAAGILIMVFKPYKTGDWIEVKEKFGKVSEIQIFNTILVSPGNKVLIIPNGQIIDDVVTNFSEKGLIRLELNVHIPYAEDFPRVKTMILNALSQIDGILKDPITEVGIETFDSHNIVLAVRPYALPDDYWTVLFQANEAIKRAFNENGVKVAYSEGVELGEIGK